MPSRASRQFVDLVSKTRDTEVVSQRGAGLEAVIQALAEFCIADMVTISERVPPAAMTTAATTDTDVLPLGIVFSDKNPSPCVTAAANREIVCCPDISLDTRWPNWTSTAIERGIRAVISVMLHRKTGPLGCLNLYWRNPRTIDSDELDVARLAAVHASLELAHHRREVELWKAIEARHLVGQAQGLIMGQYDVNAAQAFAVLRRISENSNTKVHVVAARVVAERKLVLPDRDAETPGESGRRSSPSSRPVAPDTRSGEES